MRLDVCFFFPQFSPELDDFDFLYFRAPTATLGHFLNSAQEEFFFYSSIPFQVSSLPPERNTDAISLRVSTSPEDGGASHDPPLWLFFFHSFAELRSPRSAGRVLRLDGFFLIFFIFHPLSFAAADL